MTWISNTTTEAGEAMKIAMKQWDLEQTYGGEFVDDDVDDWHLIMHEVPSPWAVFTSAVLDEDDSTDDILWRNLKGVRRAATFVDKAVLLGFTRVGLLLPSWLESQFKHFHEYTRECSMFFVEFYEERSDVSLALAASRLANALKEAIADEKLSVDSMLAETV